MKKQIGQWRVLVLALARREESQSMTDGRIGRDDDAGLIFQNAEIRICQEECQ